MGNVGSMVAFRVGHTDAEALESAYGKSYVAAQFTNLSNGEVCVKLLQGGQDREPFMGRTLPPMGTRHGRGLKILRRSREKYATPREKVERRVWTWLKMPRRPD